MAAPPRIGLTGGIGSGKSTVAARLGARGAAIIDTDAISRQLTAAGGAAIGAIARAFGPGFIDNGGALDRAAMRARVFADAGARRQLEGLLHPLILAHANAQAAAQPPGTALLVFEVPLLVEATAFRAGLRLDRVLVIDCPPAIARARAAARSGLDDAQIRAILASQAPRAARLDLADDVLVNSGSLEDLLCRADTLFDAYRTAAAADPGRPGKSGDSPEGV